ncbi:MAG: hypothetical protein ACQETL_11930 [Bacteroidota bacterium]
MRYLKPLSFCLVILLMFSCSEEAMERDCIDEKIEEYGLTSYEGETLNSCDFRMELYILDNKQYFNYYQPCSYNLTYPEDCEGNIACCSENSRNSWSDFYENATYEGIVGFRRLK